MRTNGTIRHTRLRLPRTDGRAAAAAAGVLLLAVGAAWAASHDGPNPTPSSAAAALEPARPVPDAPRPTLSAVNVPPPTEAPVSPAAPFRIQIPDLGIDAAVEEYSDAMVAAADGWVEPPHRDTVAWWSGGGWPADPADNTVYLYGHVSRIEAVFNRLAEAQVGDAVSVTTAAGTLTYRVTEVLPPVAKKDLPSVPEVAAAVPGRLVMIGCHRDPDQGTRPTTSNTVVIAEQQPRSTPSS